MKTPTKPDKSLASDSALWRMGIVLLAIFTAESAIMAAFYLSSSAVCSLGKATLDASLLSIILAPVFYRLVYRPLIRQQQAVTTTRQTLEQTEDRYRHLAEGTGALITEVDPNGTLTYANEQTLSVWGIEPADAIGRSAFDFIHPDDRAQTEAAFASWVKDSARTLSFENRQLHEDGSIRHLIWSIRVDRAPDGQVVQFSSIAQDITAQKLAQEALKVLALDFQLLSGQSLFEAVCQHLAITLEYDTVLVGQFDAKTRRTEIVGGYSHGERMALFSHQLNAPLCPEMLDKQFCVFPEDQCRRFPNQQLLQQLGIKGFLSTPLQNRDGKVTGFMVIIDSKPISRRQETSQIIKTFSSRLAVELEQIRTSDELNLSRTLYHDLFSSIPDPIIIADQQRIIVEVNQPAVRNVFGYELDELIGQSARVLYATEEDFISAGEEVFDLAYAGGKTLTSLNYRRKDGTTFPTEVNALKLVSDHNQPVGNFAVVRDVTEKRKAVAEKHRLQQQLQRSQKMEAIGQLAGGIAHDFNNILQIIIGYGEVISMQLENDSPLTPLNNNILTAADKAATLTRSLLAFSRKQEMTLKPTELNHLIDSFSEFLSRGIGSHIRLEVVPQAEKLLVMADTGQLEQTFLNLATNARDAMPDGGVLKIATSQFTIGNDRGHTLDCMAPGDYARIVISDTGKGIPREILEKIFEPFFTTKVEGEGTGLGLAMAFGIIKQHKGFMHVSSEPGHGTSFAIELPLLAAQQSVHPPAPAAHTFHGSEHILLAEDRAEVAKAMTDALRLHGYQLTVAEDGQKALDIYRATPDSFDLLLLDISMPYLSGPQVWQAINQDSPEIKTIFLSGYPSDALEKIQDEQEISILQKPIDSATLLAKVRDVLDNDRGRQASFAPAAHLQFPSTDR